MGMARVVNMDNQLDQNQVENLRTGFIKKTKR